MQGIIFLLIRLLDLYLWAIIVGVTVSWLVSFGLLNLKNKTVYKACYWINEATRPPIDLVRRFVPAIGGIDLSPMIVIFVIYGLQSILYSLL